METEEIDMLGAISSRYEFSSVGFERRRIGKSEMKIGGGRERESGLSRLVGEEALLGGEGSRGGGGVGKLGMESMSLLLGVERVGHGGRIFSDWERLASSSEAASWRAASEDIFFGLVLSGEDLELRLRAGRREDCIRRDAVLESDSIERKNR